MTANGNLDPYRDCPVVAELAQTATLADRGLPRRQISVCSDISRASSTSTPR